MQTLQNQSPVVSWCLWPFERLWALLASILKLTGRLAGGVLGLGFMIGGIVLTVTLVGAPVGIPLIILGFLLMLRSVFKGKPPASAGNAFDDRVLLL